MINTLAYIFFIVIYVAFFCYITYKIVMYLMDKMFNLILRSKVFRIMLFATLSLLFLWTGLLQLFDYNAGKNLELTRLFPLALGVSGLLLYFTVWAYRDCREKKN